MMTIKYAVYNPVDGESTMVDNREDAMQLFWQRMIVLARPYFHDTAYMTIEVDAETGAETWYNDAGKVIDRPRSAAEIESLISQTLAQTLPITELGAPDGSTS
jgi:hypothetical protein